MTRIAERVKDIDRMAVVVFISAMAVRLVYMIQISDSPFFEMHQIDALWHHIWAGTIAEGNIIGDEAFFRAPLYPYFLGIIYSIFGDGPFAPRIIQSLLGSLSAVIVYLTARDIINRRAGLIAGFTAVLYSLLIYFDNELLITSLFTFLMLLSFHVVRKTTANSSRLRYLTIGLLIGLTALARPTVLIILPAVMLYLFVANYRAVAKKSGRLVDIVIMLAGMLALILPITIRNYALSGDPVMISYQGGVNFWIGNNAEADGKTAGAPGHFKAVNEYQDNVKYSSERVAEMRTGRELTPSEISSYWFEQAFQWIGNNPVEFIELSLKKLYYLWNAYEIESNRDIYTLRSDSWLLKTLLWHGPPGFPFGLLAPLAMIGLYIAFRSGDSRLHLLAGTLLSYQLVLILFFVTARFRVPTLPFLIVLAALATDYILAKLKQPRRLIVPAVVFIGVAVISSTTLFGIRPDDRSRSNQAVASAFLRQNMLDSATYYIERAIEENPEDPNALAFLGNLRERKNDYDGAAVAYGHAIEHNPHDAYLFNRLAYSLFKIEQYDHARNAVDSSLALDSTILSSYTILSNLLSLEGKSERALDILYRGYRVDSSNSAYLNNLAVRLRDHSRFEEAIDVLERALTINPEHLSARVNLANLYFQSGNLEQAEKHYLTALNQDPDQPQANLNLAQLYLRSGRTSEAVELIRGVLKNDPDNPTAVKLMEMIENALNGG
jgi:tetratricopeptide (TPR) repeat protein